MNLDMNAFRHTVAEGAVVVDLRPFGDYVAAHIEGARPFPFGGPGPRFVDQIGAYVGEDVPLLLVDDGDGLAERAAAELTAAGFSVRGALAGGMPAWADAGLPVEELPELSATELHAKAADGLAVLDVREPFEWQQAHLAGSRLIPLGTLLQDPAAVPSVRPPIAVLCAHGNRSRVAQLHLRRFGFRDVYNVQGGIAAWMQAGLPVEQGNA